MRHAFLFAFPLAMLGAQQATPQAPAAIDVQLSNFKFRPQTIVLNHAEAYVLRLHNRSEGGHDFTAPAFFAASRIAPDDRQWITDGEVEVPPGQVRELQLTAPAAGSYKLKCSHSFHKALGMSGAIVVR